MRNVLTFMVGLCCALPVMSQSTQPGPVIQRRTPALPNMPRLSRRPVPGQAPAPLAIPAETPIVSLEGICDRAPSKSSKACKTVVTRGQLDSIVDATAPEATPVARRQFAVRYAQMMAASAVAERRHLEKDPAVAQAIQRQMKLARQQVLAAALYRTLTEQAQRVSAAETQKYYTDHQGDYEAGELRLFSIPKSVVTDKGQPLGPDKAKLKANELRQRAVAGEDFQQLQQDAYKDLGINASLPTTKLGMVRRKDLTVDEQKILDGKPGEVSEVVELPDAFLVLKLEAKQTLAVSSVQNEINSILLTEHMRKGLQDSAKNIKAEFNLAYLEMAAAPELFPMPGLGQPARRTGRRSDADSRTVSRFRRWPSLQKGAPISVPSLSQPR